LAIDGTIIVLISNTIIMAITAVATLYRIKIEKKQVQVVAENAEYKKRVEIFKLLLEKEKEEIMKMSSEEIYDMLQKVLCDANNS
jgi:hypothetical protein